VFGGVAFSQAPYAALGGNTFLVAVSEDGVANAAQTVDASRGGTLHELVQAIDVVTATRGFSVSITESSSGSDSPSVSVAFVGTVAELASAIDSLSVDATINAYASGVQLYVYIGNVLVWGVINTDQNAGWVVINSEQSPDWTDLPS
jgi:hypothetical protein